MCVCVYVCVRARARVCVCTCVKPCIFYRNDTATTAINRLSQLQYRDAVHYSVLPSIMMRFLTSVVDFPVLAIMSCLFRELKIPIVDMESAMQMLNGVPITKTEDSHKIKTFIVDCIKAGMLCPTSIVDTTVRESNNITLYVTGRQDSNGQSAMRMPFNGMEAQNKVIGF